MCAALLRCSVCIGGGHPGKLAKAAWLFLIPCTQMCSVGSRAFSLFWLSTLNIILAGISGSKTYTCIHFWDLEMTWFANGFLTICANTAY